MIGFHSVLLPFSVNRFTLSIFVIPWINGRPEQTNDPNNPRWWWIGNSLIVEISTVESRFNLEPLREMQIGSRNRGWNYNEAWNTRKTSFGSRYLEVWEIQGSIVIGEQWEAPSWSGWCYSVIKILAEHAVVSVQKVCIFVFVFEMEDMRLAAQPLFFWHSTPPALLFSMKISNLRVLFGLCKHIIGTLGHSHHLYRTDNVDVGTRNISRRHIKAILTLSFTQSSFKMKFKFAPWLSMSSIG